MRITVVVLFGLIFLASMARADEKFAVLKVGSETYSNVIVTSVTATDVYFTHDKGIGNGKLKNLDPALQKHFAVDRTIRFPAVRSGWLYSALRCHRRS